MCLALLIPGFVPGGAGAGSFEADVTPLFEASCLTCHVGTEQTPLDLTALGHDLADRETFRLWERIFDRVTEGEMPPAGARRPARRIVDSALDSLRDALLEANRAERAGQRTPLRRLTRLEYEYTIQDLLGIDPDVAASLANDLPEETDTGGFDVVAENQGISPLHVRSYLTAAAGALDEALRAGPRPETRTVEIDYRKSPYLNRNSVGKYLGAGIVKIVDDAAVMFFEGGSTYTFHSMTEGFLVELPGRYRVTIDVYPYQATSPITLTLFHGNQQGVATAALNSLIGSFDLVEPEGRVVEVTPYLRPRDLVAPSLADAYRPPDDKVSYFAPERNVQDYPWEGIAFRSMTIEGPLFDEWPPRSARELLAGDRVRRGRRARAHQGALRARRRRRGELRAAGVPAAALGGRTRNLRGPGEARPRRRTAVPRGRPRAAARHADRSGVRLPRGQPGGGAGRLPDRDAAFLLPLALDAGPGAPRPGRRRPPVGRRRTGSQVDRMLDDPKSERFIEDFAGQAFRLYEMNATTPDKALYPEYDSRLGQAMARETRLFLAELVAENLSVGNLIDSDFTFLNRRLAEHYGIEGSPASTCARWPSPRTVPAAAC